MTCANSIFNVLATAHGKGADKPVEIPRPDFGAIMADQKIGPVWRLMMSDYEKDLAAAKEQAKPGDTHTTDGGVAVDSAWIISEIQNTTMGGEKGMADAKAMTGEAGAAMGVAQTVSDAQKAPLETINNKRIGLRDSLDGVWHYASTDFGYNKRLGGGKGMDDDMNEPEVRGPEDTGFDPVQLESTFGLYTSLSRNASEFVVAAAAAGSSVGDTSLLGKEKEAAQDIANKAQSWAAEAKALIGMTDALMYGAGHGTIGKGEDKLKRTRLRLAVLTGINDWNGRFGTAYAAPAEQAAPGKAG